MGGFLSSSFLFCLEKVSVIRAWVQLAIGSLRSFFVEATPASNGACLAVLDLNKEFEFHLRRHH
jgi:hypothetical protein